MPLRSPAIRSYWLNKGRIFKVLNVSSGTDKIILQALDTKQRYMEHFSTFYIAYKQVFKIGDVATFLNRSPRSIYRYEARGQIQKQKSYAVGASKMLRFYSLDDVWYMHEMISQLHRGRPRIDGGVINNTMPPLLLLKRELTERFRIEI